MDLSTSVLGHRVAVPVCVAATAMQRMAHPLGETATARGERGGTGGAGLAIPAGLGLLRGLSCCSPFILAFGFYCFTLLVVSLSMKRGRGEIEDTRVE